jgi:hypothetical protein
MSKLRRHIKRFSRSRSKQVKASRRDKSVTRTSHDVQLTGVTLTGPDRPKKRYDALRPWLDLANNDDDQRVLRLERLVISSFSAVPGVRTALQASVRASLEHVLACRERLREDSRWAERYKRVARETGLKTGPVFDLAAWDTGPLHLDNGELVVNGRGVIAQNPHSVRAFFVSALVGAEIDRFGRCPICNRFYYGKRRDQRTCSRGCANALRARRWRDRQEDYEYRRKLRRAGVKPPTA